MLLHLKVETGPSLFRQLVDIDNFYRCRKVGTRRAREQAGGQIAPQEFALMLRGELLIRRHQNDVAWRAASHARQAKVLQDMGMHDQRFARPGGGLHSDGTHIVGGVFRHPAGHSFLPHRVDQVAAQGFGVLEIAAQIALREQQSQPLIWFPTPPSRAIHAQPPTQCRDLSAIVFKPVRVDTTSTRIDPARVFILLSYGEIGRSALQPV